MLFYVHIPSAHSPCWTNTSLALLPHHSVCPNTYFSHFWTLPNVLAIVLPSLGQQQTRYSICVSTKIIRRRFASECIYCWFLFSDILLLFLVLFLSLLIYQCTYYMYIHIYIFKSKHAYTYWISWHWIRAWNYQCQCALFLLLEHLQFFLFHYPLKETEMGLR